LGPAPEAKIQLNSRLVVILLGVLLLIQLIHPFKGWMVLLVGLGGAFYFSYLWARSLQEGLSIKREMRFGWSQVGDRLQERFTLINEGWAPAIWIGVMDLSDMPGYQVSTVTGVGGRSLKHWFKRGVCTRRGLYTLGPTSLQTGDPFGFFSVDLKYSTTSTMMVMPPIVPLPSIDVAPGGRIGEGRVIVSSLEQTTSVSSVREYMPGDHMRRIHWPTSARKGDFYVRTFDSTPSSDWWIYLDLNLEVQAGEAEAATEEHAIILAASLTDQGIRSGKAVGLVSHGDELIWLPPRLEEDQRWEILRALALIEPGKRNLADLLSATRSTVRQRSSLVIITPDVEGSWLDALVLLMRRGVVPTILLMDVPAFGGDRETSRLENTLLDLGVHHYRISPDLLDRPEVRPEQEERWRITPHGRALPVDTRELGWRRLI
jgi:uncharacterized protein (DUF58 family)